MLCVCERQSPHRFAGRHQALLDEGQSDGNQSFLEDSLPHRAAVIVVFLQEDGIKPVSASGGEFISFR